MRFYICILLFLFLTITAWSQTNPDTGTYDIYEKLLEEQTQDVDDSDILDDLKQIEDNPIDINRASRTALENIPFIHPLISGRIIDYRKNKKFENISELLNIEGIDLELYNNIKPFLIVKQSKTGKNRILKNEITLELRDRIINELQLSRGFKENIYLGSRPKIYNRLKASYKLKIGTFNAGFVQEKDAGEKNFIDHLGGFLEYRSDGIMSQLIIGDYNLGFGQGLTLSGPLGFSKGSDAVASSNKYGRGIKPYISVNEVQFFRGIAAKLKIPFTEANLNLYGYYSDNDFDASIDTTLQELSAFYYDGNHRTDTELNRKNTAKEKMFGGRISFEKGSLKLGYTYYNSKLNKSFKEEEMFGISGDKFSAMGLDYNFLVFNTYFFGEITRSRNGAIGGISGIRSLFFERNKYSLESVISIRFYPEDLITLHSFGFGEKSGDTKNEKGIYTGLKFKIPGLLNFNAYFDQYKFPYRSYFIPVPVTGNDLLLYSEIKPLKNFSIAVKYKSENKEDVIRISNEFKNEVNHIFTRSQKNYRLQFDFIPSRNIFIRSRAEYVQVNYMNFQPSQKGILFFTDLKVNPVSDLTLNSRFIIFQTDSFDSRIYEYENDLEGTFTNNALYGKGFRWYVLAKYKLLKYLQISAKYAETIQEGARSIGSGYDEISGDMKNRFSLQLDVKF